MSRNRLPPLNSDNSMEGSEVVYSSAVESEYVVKPKRKKSSVNVPSNGNEGQIIESGTTKSSRERRRQAPIADGNASATDESQGGKVTSSVKQSRKAKTRASTEQLVSDVQKPKTNAAKKKRKTISRVIENPVFVGDRGLASELADLDEDIVDLAAANAEPDSSRDQITAEVVVVRSEPTQQVYLEKSGGFKTANKTKLNVKRSQAANAAANETTTDIFAPRSTVDFALSTHRVFKTITVFLQGLLAGLVLWQIVSTMSLISFGSTVFSAYYMPLSIPFQSAYFFLSAVSCVAALDRYDLAHTTRRLLMRSVSFQAGTVCVLFYFSGLIISLGTAYLDEGIGLNESAVLTENTMTSGCNWLCQWQILNICRGILAILGWFVVSLSPATDRLTKSLLRMNDDVLQPNNNRNYGTPAATKRATDDLSMTVWTAA